MNYLRSLGGANPGAAIRKMLRKVASKEVLSAYSLKGRKNKLAFQGLNICSIIIGKLSSNFFLLPPLYLQYWVYILQNLLLGLCKAYVTKGSQIDRGSGFNRDLREYRNLNLLWWIILMIRVGLNIAYNVVIQQHKGLRFPNASAGAIV